MYLETKIFYFRTAVLHKTQLYKPMPRCVQITNRNRILSQTNFFKKNDKKNRSRNRITFTMGCLRRKGGWLRSWGFPRGWQPVFRARATFERVFNETTPRHLETERKRNVRNNGGDSNLKGIGSNPSSPSIVSSTNPLLLPPFLPRFLLAPRSWPFRDPYARL